MSDAARTGGATGSGPDGASRSGRVRVLIADDHPVVRDGLRGMLAGDPGLEVVAEAADGQEVVDRARLFEPDVVLLDLRMPRVDGVAAIRGLAAAGVATHVLVLTTYGTDRDVLSALDAGATGYLLKDAPREELFRAVRAAARGERVLAPAVADRVRERERGTAPDALTPRELEILRLVADGASNPQAAERLFISEATVKTHLLHVYAKLGVRDRAAAVAVAYERGLLTAGGAS